MCRYEVVPGCGGLNGSWRNRSSAKGYPAAKLDDISEYSVNSPGCRDAPPLGLPHGTHLNWQSKVMPVMSLAREAPSSAVVLSEVDSQRLNWLTEIIEKGICLIDRWAS